MTDRKMVWVDIETTGLHPLLDSILEVGVVITNEQLDKLAQYSTLVKPPAAFIMDDIVTQMHRTSGLFGELERVDAEPYYLAQHNLKRFLEANEATGLPMCGSSVHFDRQFLKHKMPVFEQCFHYRNIDVSTIKELFKLYEVENKLPEPFAAKRHRALSDIDDSIEELRWYLTHLEIL